VKNVNKYQMFFGSITKIILKIGGLKIRHKHYLDNWENGLVAANHISLFDPPFIGTVLWNNVGFLAKKELFSYKFTNWIMTGLNAIPIKRGMIDRTAIAITKQRLNDKKNVAIFPEGSRKNFVARPGIGKIAISIKVPVLPIKIVNSNHLIACIFRRKKLEIIFGEPISVEKISEFEDSKDGYRKFSHFILEIINGLKDESKDC
jgi:1-acyl-sn-glycerol-3-phosphate acyltransferase